MDWFFLFCLVWVVILFGWRYYRWKQADAISPKVPLEGIQFEERGASGCSHKTIFTKMGGARNCLEVTVTDKEVWIRPSLPFRFFSQQPDLEHRFSRASITNVKRKRSIFADTLLLDYRDEHGQTHRLSLMLRKPDEFLRALELQTK